jgi:His-Xaa-Ser system radical SAM maturase HxsB
MVERFAPPAAYQLEAGEWEFLPFRFERMNGRVLITNMVGEHLFLERDEFDGLLEKSLPADSSTLRRLRGKHIVRSVGEQVPVELLAMKTRTRYRRLPEFTSLHIFVVTLRCEHSCPYCQVSRQSSDKRRFDMSEETALRALDATFASPSRNIKIEFQGGEPLLNFPLIELIVSKARQINEAIGKNLTFVIATNLALLDDAVLDFCAANDVFISTSLDGPEDLHNKNRPRPGGNSWRLAVEGIARVRERLGIDRVSALMTTTEASLDRACEIVDCYLEQGLRDVFLRPLSPYGFAVKTRAHAAYDADRWLGFYREGLDYILELNGRGVPILERYAAIILRKMLTNDEPGYVDLMSPAGIGIAALVYNFDGDVYASDEGRMLAEMGDKTFRLGNLHENAYEEIMLSDALLNPLEDSFALSVPMCTDCAFEPYCGADPVFHHTTQGDFVGHKAESAFCRRNMGIFKLLLSRYHSDSGARETFRSWAQQ